MALRISGTSEFQYTQNGIIGAAFFLVGLPASSLAAWYSLASQVERTSSAYRIAQPDQNYLVVLAAAAGMASLVGLVLMLVGRRLVHRVRVDEETFRRPV